jgi:LCP family protein required for cell wall assembly
MIDDEPAPDFGLYDEPKHYGRKILFGLVGIGATLFVIGGLFSGLVLLDNWKMLARSRVQVQVPGGGPVVVLDPPIVPLPPIFSGSLGSQERTTAQDIPDWPYKDRFNVLLLGVDHRKDEPIEQSRSDTVMVVSIDPATKSAVMISLPRDLWIQIPGYYPQRINVAHAVGGPELAMRTVTANFGLPVNNYARIDFRGFEQVVDTLGGVFVDVERPIKDDEYPTEDYGVMRIYIPPGPQWMDGRTALQYARSRHSENDFARARRQQRLLVAMRDRAIQARMILKAGELIPLGLQTVNTNFGPVDLLRLAKLATEVERDRVASVVVDANYATPLTLNDGANVLVPNRAAVDSAIRRAIEQAATAAVPPEAATASPAQAAPAQAPLRVEVLNGTIRQGLASTTADWLRQRGVEVTRFDGADRSDYAETRLLTQPGREPAANALAAALGLPSAAVQTAAPAPGGPDVRLILGQTFQLPQR